MTLTTQSLALIVIGVYLMVESLFAWIRPETYLNWVNMRSFLRATQRTDEEKLSMGKSINMVLGAVFIIIGILRAYGILGG